MDDVNNAHHTCAHEADISILNSAILEMKESLKRISDLLMSNAVLEEQADNTRKRLNGIDERLRGVEINIAHSSGKSVFTERVIWTLVCTALAGWKFIGG